MEGIWLPPGVYKKPVLFFIYFLNRKYEGIFTQVYEGSGDSVFTKGPGKLAYRYHL